jgi:hypothetical protein
MMTYSALYTAFRYTYAFNDTLRVSETDQFLPDS